MDGVVMGGSRGVNDFAGTTSKLGSIVQINSISIDISSSMEAMESAVHEHFSIRGFVAGMRNKDRKKCFPFASEGNDVDQVDYLPPLCVPEFRWWQCPNCIPKDVTKRTTEEMEVQVASKSDANKSSFKNVGAKDGFFIQRRKNTEEEDNDQSKSNKTPNLCCSERHKDITCSKGKTDNSDNIAGNSCDKPEVNQQQVIERLNNNTPDATDAVCLADQPLCEVEAPDNASSGSDGTFSVLPHRRKPKLRYLADILVEERNQTSSNPRTRSSSSCGMQAESTDMEAVFVPQLEVDVPADVAKGAQSHERKRKTALEEDREPLVAICPRAAAKRIKGLVLDSEKKSRRVEISDPESKVGASTGLEVPRTHRIKPKKPKLIDTDKKMRKIRRDDEITQMREYLLPNNVSSANLQEQVVPVETNLGKLGNAPSILVEMGRDDFRSSLSGKQVEKTSDPSMVKMPEVGPDNDYLWPPRKNILNNCSIRGTMALDLSLNSFMNAEENHNDQASFRERRCIPDLNVEYPGKTAMTEEEEPTILSKKRSLPLQNTLDASASCSNEIVREEGKRVSELKNNDDNVEWGPSDDIPMEIVELLARNQHERALGNSKRHMLGVDDITKGYSAVVDGRPGTANFPFASKINGLKVANGNLGVKPNKRPTDMRRPEKSNFRLLSSSPPSQLRKTEYSASASTMARPTSTSWEELLYSCGRETVPFRLSVPQDHPIQQSGMSPHSFLDERRKERTAAVEIKDSKGKKAVADVGKLKDGRIRSSYTPVGSMDAYSNETIPAMQLLSLMDQRVRSGSSYEVGSKSSLDKPFSPCKHHPRLNGKENHNLFRVPFFPQNSSSKDVSMLRYGVYSSGETSFKAPSNLRVEVPREVRNSKPTPLEGSSNLDRRTERSNAVFGDCTLNRNPADFSIPEVGNEFTICSKDLRRRRKRNAFEEKSRTGNVDGRKRERERMRKNA